MTKRKHKNNKVKVRTKLSENQIIDICKLMIENHLTIRKTVEEWNKISKKECNITKSTLCVYIHNKLPELDKDLYKKITIVMKENILLTNSNNKN